MADLRICNKCGVGKPATTEYFNVVGKGRSSPDGLKARCKECERRYLRHYRERNPGSGRLYYEKNKQFINQKSKDYYEINKEQQLNWQREYAKRRRTEEPERVLSLEAARRERNREQIRNSQRAYYARNKEECSARILLWHKENKERSNSHTRNYRARKRAAEGTHTAKDIAKLWDGQKGRCWWCSTTLDGGYHVDHRIPLIRGGTNGPENLVLACPSCNCAKGSKMPWEMTEPRLL